MCVCNVVVCPSGDTSTHMSGEQQPKHTVAQCVELLSSSSDEQKFVGLLLATKLMREEDDLQRIFNASLSFVRRMMMTPSSEAANPYRALALSVLASFGASADLASRRDYCTAAAAVGPLLSQQLRTADMTAQELQDCGQVLFLLLRQTQGLVDPAFGRLLTTAIAPMAATALAGPQGKANHGEAASGPTGVIADACDLIERVCAAHAESLPATGSHSD